MKIRGGGGKWPEEINRNGQSTWEGRKLGVGEQELTIILFFVFANYTSSLYPSHRENPPVGLHSFKL